ncbi:MAG: hypothetical protein RR364_01745 [Lachnospiraceae bacterium]
MDNKQDNEIFLKSLKDIKVPVLVLDERWHHLFTQIGKSSKINKLEEALDSELSYQGHLNDEVSNLKKAKSNLMKSIMDNMDGAEDNAGNALQLQKLNENKRLINEVNDQLEACEDEQLEMPKRIKEANELLMVESMSYCYDKLHYNAEEIAEIGTWIRKMRRELKKNIIIKQSHEHDNQQIYNYMHDILGASVIDVFDIKYDEDGSVTK